MKVPSLFTFLARAPFITQIFITVCFAQSSKQPPELVVQTGHSSYVTSIVFSPDGKTLASAGADNTVKLWDVASGRELRTINRCWAVLAFSADGKFLTTMGVAGGFDNYDIATGAKVRSTILPHVIPAWGYAISQDRKMIALGQENKTVRLVDASTGRELRTISGNASQTSSFSFSSDGRTLAGGSENKKITFWDVTSGAELRTITTPHRFNVSSLLFSNDGNILASQGDEDVTISLWDATSGTELRTLKGHPHQTASMAFSPDGRMLATGSLAGTIQVWDVATGSELHVLSGHSGYIMSLVFSPEGKTLASGGLDKAINLWDATDGRRIHTLAPRSAIFSSIVASSDGGLLASGAVNGRITLWDLRSGQPLRGMTTYSLNPLAEAVFDPRLPLAFSPNGKTLISGGNDVKLWEVGSGRQLRVLGEGSEWVTSVAFSGDKNSVASGTENGTFKRWSAANGRELGPLNYSIVRYEFGGIKGAEQTRHSSVNAIAFSRRGRLMASGGDTIKMWNAISGRELWMAKGSNQRTMSLAFSPDERVLASAGEYAIKLWDAATGRELRKFGDYPIVSVSFSKDGEVLAGGGIDGAIRFWDLTGRELRRSIADPSVVPSVTFSADDKILMSGGNSIKLWESSSGKLLATLLSFKDEGWLVVTPDGLFDGAPRSWNQILWRFNNDTFDHVPVEAFYSEYYHPGLLSEIMTGKRPTAPNEIAEKDRRQPELKIALSEPIYEKETRRNLLVKIDVAEAPPDMHHKAGSGTQDVRLFRNGSLVKVWHGDVLNGKNIVTLETTIPIVAGENKLTAYAFNHDNIKSSDAELVVTGADSLKRQGTAYILAIGVNEYSNSQYNLRYALADAEDFSAEVKRQQEMLKRYAKVEVTSLSNANATKANITQKLAEIAKQSQPEDAVMVYFAGHGTAQGNQFYLIPHDLGYTGARDNLDEAGLKTILAHSISDRELEKLFEGIDAGQLLLVIDACNSGQALEAEEKRRGPMNSKGLAQLAYEKGMYVMTAAQSYQAAQEAQKLGHGFLTYALVESGLKQGAADRDPKNGTIDIREWLNFATEEVPRMQEENSQRALSGKGRYVVFVGDGTRTRDATSNAPVVDNIQRPRIFYRRELEANPLVMAVTGSPAPR